jgi:hypothetical protein
MTVLLSAESIVVALLLLGALIFLAIKRRPLAASGVAVLLFHRVATLAWSFFLPNVVSGGIDNYMIATVVFQTLSSIMFVVGLGLIIAQIFVKRPAGGFQGHP